MKHSQNMTSSGHSAIIKWIIDKYSFNCKCKSLITEEPRPEYSFGTLNGVSAENSLILDGIRWLLLQLMGTVPVHDDGLGGEEDTRGEESQHSPVSSSLRATIWSKRRANLSSQGHSASSPILSIMVRSAVAYIRKTNMKSTHKISQMLKFNLQFLIVKNLQQKSVETLWDFH